jgi:ankyrin repeat protein
MEQNIFNLLNTRKQSELVAYVDTHPGWYKEKDSRGRSVLHETMNSGNYPELDGILLYLISAGGPFIISEQDAEGYTALHIAALNDRYLVAHKLIEGGASPNATDVSGQTPLHKAVLAGRLDMAKLLIQNGADVNARDANGKTPLDLLIQDFDIISLLISNGASISPVELVPA